LWGSAPESLQGDVTLWTKTTKLSVHLPLRDALAWDEDDDDALRASVEARQEIYISPGLRRPGLPSDKKGTWEDVVALCGFVLDIDIFDPSRPDAHNAKNLPRNDRDVDLILNGSPDPSLVVYTGYGMHFWWLFEHILELPNRSAREQAKRAYRKFQQPFLDRAKQFEFRLDDMAAINHVFRLPGTKNWK
jgi:putative DNA primase/helicase